MICGTPIGGIIALSLASEMKPEELAKDSISSFAKEAIGQASINQGQVSSIKTPLPPLLEQHRIVKKADELLIQ